MELTGGAGICVPPGVFAAVMPALVDLSADAGEGSAADTVLAVEIRHGQRAVPGRVVDSLCTVPIQAPNAVLPGALVREGFFCISL